MSEASAGTIYPVSQTTVALMNPDISHHKKVLITAVGAAGIGLMIVLVFNLWMLFVIHPYFLILPAAFIFIPPLIAVIMMMRRPDKDRSS